MNLIREIVGGAKNRFKEEGFNLDLTYISSRIIAMAFPASGIEKIYRNSISAVAEFMDSKHPNGYIVINVSGREIDEKKLKNVHSYKWEDHKNPPLHMLFTIAQQVALFFREDPARVAVIHCNHGKGRTGTLICCLLLYLGAFADYKEAMKFYARKRFEVEGLGVTQPCQIKYIEYFSQLLKTKLFPRVLAIKKILIANSEDLQQPYVKIRALDQEEYIINTHKSDGPCLTVAKEDQIAIMFREQIPLAGDIVVEFKQDQKVGKNIVGMFPLNSAFIPENNQIFIRVADLSPLSVVKAAELPDNFQMKIVFKPVCTCETHAPIKDRCPKCKKALKREDEHWEIIAVAISLREEVVGEGLWGNLEEETKEERRKRLMTCEAKVGVSPVKKRQ